jgi:broad specificity phosphatase PhoE
MTNKTHACGSCTTTFWLIRHAMVEEDARNTLYGVMDVGLCPQSLRAQQPVYRALAGRLPKPAQWVVSPLSRTARTAAAIFQAGYPPVALTVEPRFIEQNLGEWQGLAHAALPPKLRRPAHPFWPLAGEERPPGGESMKEVVCRVGQALESLGNEAALEHVVVVSHGGAIRAAVAHAMKIPADAALHLSVQNLSLTCLERSAAGWRVLCVNAALGWPEGTAGEAADATTSC